VGIGSALTGMACLYSHQGEQQQSLDAVTEALHLLRDQPNAVVLGNALIVAGRTALIAGDVAAARTHFERNMGLRRRIGDRPGVAVAHHHFGMLAISEGDFAAAERSLAEALAIYEETRWDASYWSAWALYHMGMARFRLGDERQAALAVHEALAQ